MIADRCRRLLAHACLAVSLLGGAALHAAETTTPPRQLLRVVGDDNYPPFLFRTEDGEAAGYLVDVWQLWQKKTGVRVELRPMNWAAAQKTMQQGGADVIESIFETTGRAPFYDFSPPYADLPVAIYSHVSISGLSDTQTLKGFQVGVMEGDACIEQLTDRNITALKYYPNYTAMIKAALAGEIRIFCLDEYPANFYMYQLHAEEQFHKAFDLYRGQFHRAVRKGDLATLQLVERGMAAITPAEDAALRKKWMGSPIPFNAYGRHLGIAVLGLLLLGALLFAWNRMLASRVAARTQALNRTLLELKTSQEAMVTAKIDRQMHELFDAAPIPMVYINDPQISFFNQHFSSTFGYTPEELPSVDQWWLRAYPDPTYREWVRDHWESACQRAAAGDGVIPAEEYRVTRKDGQEVIMLIGGRLIGHGLLVTFTDLTGYRHLENRLGQSEERLSLAMDASNDGLWDWNMLTDECYCSPAYFRMLGLGAENFAPTVQACWIDLLHPDDRDDIVAEAGRSLAEKGHYELEFRLRAANGDYRWILSRGKVAERDPRGRPTRAIGTHTDITERKQLEIGLRDANDEQRAIFNSAGIGIVLIRDRVIRRCNRRLEEMFGYGPGEFDGRSTRLWYIDDDDYLTSGNEIYPEIALGRVHTREQQYVRRDGSLFWARLHGQLLDPYNAEKGALAVLEDISNERETLDALRLAKETAEIATRTKSEFLANMSHEIRTPMNAILGLSRLLGRQIADPGQRERLDKITAAGRHLLTVINDILDFSKIEAGKLALENREIDPRMLANNIASMLTEVAQEKGIALHVDNDPQLQLLLGDPTRLTQAFLNLANNAIKFTERGSVTLRTLRLGDEEGRVRVRFEVVDTGIGIAEEQQPRLFQAFEQANGSTTRTFGGTGLGLAITRRLAELMGGETGVASRLGEGSTFWFTALLEKAGQGAVALAAAPPENGFEQRLRREFAGYRLLLVEDDPINQEVAHELLEAAGLAVDIAEDGQQAVDILVATPPGHYALILMDMQMPRMDGLEATLKIRQLPGWQRTPVIAMTANAFTEDRERCLAVGMNDFVAKPTEPDKLYRTVHDWLGDAGKGRG